VSITSTTAGADMQDLGCVSMIFGGVSGLQAERPELVVIKNQACAKTVGSKAQDLEATGSRD